MSNKLIVLQGIIASGKSTLAKQYVDEKNYIRVNKDLIREMLWFGSYTSDKEDIVKSVEVNIVENLLLRNYNVIIDDTNLKDYPEKWNNIAEKYETEFQLIILDTPLEECIERDSFRRKPIGEDRIREMYSQLQDS
jgi:predicted kinase